MAVKSLPNCRKNGDQNSPFITIIYKREIPEHYQIISEIFAKPRWR